LIITTVPRRVKLTLAKMLQSTCIRDRAAAQDLSRAANPAQLQILTL
jgi:hypothetical protein